jgi:hypothetical protein
MLRIDLYQRSHDWMTTIEGNKGQWESGRTPEEAIKKINISFPDTIDQEVVYRGTDFTAEGHALVMGVKLLEANKHGR